MRPDKALIKKITKDILISLFIYALPIILMFGWFYIKGEKPWQKQESNNVKTIPLKN
jgi:hypothetical protein